MERQHDRLMQRSPSLDAVLADEEMISPGGAKRDHSAATPALMRCIGSRPPAKTLEPRVPGAHHGKSAQPSTGCMRQEV